MTTYVWFVRGREHAAMCRTSIESVCRSDKNVMDCVVVTDEATHARIGDGHWNVPNASSFYNIEPGHPIMVANIEAQLTALVDGEDDDYVFLDTDVLLLKPLPHCGQLTVTWRDHVGVSEEGEKVAGIASAMPYNYGVMRVKRCKATIEAFIWLRERVRRMHPQQQKWYGNQLAMTELAGPRPEAGIQLDQRRIPWQLAKPSTLLSVGKIPCQFYNYTPRGNPEPVADKHVLHFKGKSRHLMADWARGLGLGWYL